MDKKKIPPSPPFAKGGEETPPGLPLSGEEKNAPYPGLRPYREDEQGKFFGREADKAILVDKILGNRLTLLFAASGVGKSSLLQAAVIPYLKADGGENLSVVYHIDWVNNPVNSVRLTVLKVLHESGVLPKDVGAEGDTLAELLMFCGLFVRQPLVLILDQFEDFFRYQRTQNCYQTFIEQLVAVINSPSIPVSLVLSMREDFALELNVLKSYLPDILFENFYRLEKMDLKNARQAIIFPAQKVGYRYSDLLLDELVKDLSNQYLVGNPTVNNLLVLKTIELPYLQIICAYLWKHRPKDGFLIDLGQYLNSGRASSILHNHLNEVLQGFKPSEKYIVDRILSCLVNYPGFKVAYTNEGLSNTTGIDLEEINIILEKLEKTRIIRKNNNMNELWYELSHDMYSQIIREWQYAWRDTLDFATAFDDLAQRNIFKRIDSGILEKFSIRLGRLLKIIKDFKFGIKAKNKKKALTVKLNTHPKVKIIKNDPSFFNVILNKVNLYFFGLFDESYGVYYLLWTLIAVTYVAIIILLIFA